MTQTGIVAELKAGLYLHAGLNAERVFGATNCQRAEDRFGPTGCGVVEAAREILTICGERGGLDSRGAIEAAFSGSTGESIFGNVVEAAMLEPFKSGDSTLGWVLEREILNFKTNERIRRKRVEQLQSLPRGQTAEHHQPEFGDAETYRAHRFAKTFQVDSQDLVTHDLSAITDPARMFGEAALSLKKDLVYSKLLENANLVDGVAAFDSTRGNLNTTTALSEANLDASLASMELLRENDLPVDALAKYLVCPPELGGLARRLNREMGNPLTVRSDSRLSNGVVDPLNGTVFAGSATTWYLSAADGPLEFGYISSNRPTLRSYTLDKGQWGVGWDVVFDVGAAMVGHLGLQKNTA